MALKRLAKLALAGAAVAVAFAAGHFLHIPLPQPQTEAPPTEPPVVAKAEPKPEPPKHETLKPQPPVTFAVPSVPVGTPMPIAPPSFDVPSIPVAPPVSVTPLPPPSVIPVAPSAPHLPPAFPSVTPNAPSAPLNFEVGPQALKPSAPPAEPEIVEPVASVHRFDGKYLGGDAKHALVYVEAGEGKAEVRCRPLTAAIPNADEDAKAEAKSVAIPAGKTAYHGGRAFITTPRELLVVNAECQIEWRFALPGKADSGETLLDLAGFRDGKVTVVSNRPAADGKKPLGRVYTLDAITGEAVALSTVAEGFDPAAVLLQTPGEQVVAVGGDRIFGHSLRNGERLAAQVPSFPVAHPASVTGGVYVSTQTGVGLANTDGFRPLLSEASGTAAPASGGRGPLFAPVKWRSGRLALVAVESTNRPEWEIPVAKAITAAPLLRGSSVYFVAGDVLYRADAKTGTVCWKLTLPLGPTDALTELTFADGALHASGGGVLVRVADRRGN